MQFKLSKKDFPYRHWEYKNINNSDYVRIVPERGGLITSWVCNEKEMLYFDEIRFNDPSKSIRGGIPVLFPICGNLPDNKLFINSIEYSMKQHGFARDLHWDISSFHDQDGILLSLSETNKTLLSYPFYFSIKMRIRILKDCLDITIIIHNKGEQEMPYSFGLHPYFKIQNLEKVSIKGLSDQCFDHLTLSKSLTEDMLAGLHKGVDFLAQTHRDLLIQDLITQRSIKLLYDFPMDLGVVWTDPPRDMVCVEPWTRPRNSLVNGNRMLSLSSQADQTLKCSFISIEPSK